MLDSPAARSNCWSLDGTLSGEARAFCRSRSPAPPSSARPGLPSPAGAKPYLIFYALNILQYIFYSAPLPLYFLLKETIHQKEFDVLGEQKIINVRFFTVCNSLDLSELPASNLLSVISVSNLGNRIKACNWVNLVKFDELLYQNIKFLSQVEENKSLSRS